MSKVLALYNPLSGTRDGEQCVDVLRKYYPDQELLGRDITTVDSFERLLQEQPEDCEIVICGGDGTLNRFVNQTYRMELKHRVSYFPTGSGNDFLRDLGKTAQDGPVRINDYIRNLPCVSVNGKTYRFLNGVGYGIDGYCCEVGEKLRKQGKKPDYTGIAIKGLLFHYQSTNAVVTVDGVEHRYKRVWIAPTMHGRYYGGGMMAAPTQVRNSPDGELSLLVMHKLGRLGILCVFPSIFKGKHINHSSAAVLHKGHDITVTFDRPVTLQIDGEVITNVSGYHAYSRVPVKSR